MAESLGQKIRRWILEEVPIREILRRRNAIIRGEHEDARAERRRKEEAEEKARVARMKPPARCWRIGRQVFWEPPDSPERVIWYRIYEQHGDGSWGVHGTTLPPTAREAVLYGDGLCRVEAKYAQTGHATPGLGPVLKADPDDPRFLVNTVRYYVAEKREQGRVEGSIRWRRVLAGLGVIEAKVGWAGRAPVAPMDPPMSAAEAQDYAARGWGRWIPVARALARLQRNG